MKFSSKVDSLAIFSLPRKLLLLSLVLFAGAYAAPAIPVLSSPANNTTGLPRVDTLTWTASAGANTYRVQLSTDSNFATTTLDDSTLVTPLRVTGTLANNTIYYWRVNAKDSTGTSAFSARRTFTTIVGTPTLNTPANNAVNVALSSNLAWFTTTGATTYRVQLSTDSTFATTLVDDSTVATNTRAVGPLASATVYYWHVNAKNSGGTSVYSTRRSFTTLAVPAVPVLNAPANNATGVAVSSNLTWGAVSGAATYRVQLSTDSTFATTLVDDSTPTTGSRATGTLANNTAYYWRVNAKNAIGTSAFSTRRNFTTVAFAIPAAPALTAPAQNATNVALSGNLTWTASTNATTYRVQLSTDSNFATTTLDDSAVATTSRAYGPLTANTVYYWHVNAKDSLGSSAFSTRRSFTTLATPTVPTLNTPVANAINIAVSSNLTWTAVSGAATYRVQLSTDSNFTTTILDDSTVATTTRATGTLANSTIYYWRVNAKNAIGTSAFSATRNFTTVALTTPTAPTLTTPANNAINVAISSSLTWAASTGAATYRVQLSPDSTFATTTVDDSTLAVTTRAIGPLANNTIYYWRVNAKNAAGTSAFSTRRVFTTAALTAPGAPALSTPTDLATGIALSTSLTWTASTNATTYRVQLSIDSNFATTTVDDSTVAGTNRAVGPLANGTVYYWRVNAKDSVGTSAFSARRSFTTVPLTPPSVPLLTSPANNATSLPLSDTLSWTDSTGALTYRVQLSIDSNFVTKVVDDSTVTATNRVVNSLVNGTLYYWRVNAKNSSGTSAFSTTRNFTTVAAALPTVPGLSSPANNATGLPVIDTLKWTASTGAVTYRVQLSTDSNFATTTVNDSTVTGTSRVVTALANSTVYYWRVNAKNGSGTSAFSTRRAFTTIALNGPPAVPTLTSPANNAKNLPLGDTLRWNASAGAVTYHVQLSYDTLFLTGLVVPTTIDDTTITTNSRVTPPLANGNQYYWRVNAKNANGTSAYSALRTFSTALTVPTPTLPVNNATAMPLTDTLQWTTSQDASTYHVQLSTDSTFATTLVNDSSLTAASRIVGPLSSNTRYFWRVASKNSVGTSNYSALRNFTTVAGVFGTPVLTSPANNATGLPVNDTLKWNTTTGALTYRVQLSTDSTFATTLINDSTITTTSRVVGSLTNGTRYYWRVNAKSTTTTSAFSSLRTFTTLFVIPLAPNLSSPASNALEIPTSDTLKWNASAGATTYRLQLSRDSSFATTTLNDSTITGTSTFVTGLTSNVVYYWRVNAKNVAGTSAYSATRRFTTAVPIIPNALIGGHLLSGAEMVDGNLLRFGLTRKSRVEISLFDSQGRLMRKVLDAERNPGSYEVPLPIDNLRGAYYLIDFKTNDLHKTMKLVL